jgi:hypothetical protein
MFKTKRSIRAVVTWMIATFPSPSHITWLYGQYIITLHRYFVLFCDLTDLAQLVGRERLSVSCRLSRLTLLSEKMPHRHGALLMQAAYTGVNEGQRWSYLYTNHEGIQSEWRYNSIHYKPWNQKEVNRHLTSRSPLSPANESTVPSALGWAPQNIWKFLRGKCLAPAKNEGMIVAYTHC